MTVAGQVALVTGGSRGIGAHVAAALAGAGASVAVLSRSGAGDASLVLEADVRDRGQVEGAVAKVEAQLGPIDLVVCNAGTLDAIGPAWDVDPEAWWRDVETSLRGAFLVARAALPGMIERGRGRVVNVASGVALRQSPYQSGYAAGKAALVSLTESLAAELAGTGVSVFAVAPGFVETDLTRNLLESREGRRWLPEAAGSRRVDPARTAELVLRLASGEADALSGRFVHALDDLDELLSR